MRRSEKKPTPFHQCLIELIRRIPRGKVASYGQLAAMAGDPKAARQVVRILHTLTEKYKLPWHRVVNKQGKISLPQGSGYELQRSLLKKEGIKFKKDDLIDMDRFCWRP
jgi:methylated-DNA-protein-cysteine methyltransferase-like protein